MKFVATCSSMKDLKGLNLKAYVHVTHIKGKSSFAKGYFKKKMDWLKRSITNDVQKNNYNGNIQITYEV